MTLSPRLQIKRSFSKAASTYEQAAGHQKNIAARLVECYQAHHGPEDEVQMLDLGCGTGFVEQHCDNKNIFKQCINLDLSESMLKSHQSGLSVCSDIQHLPFKESSFDVCLSSYAFQWSKDIDSLFDELIRILRPGGKLFFSVPGLNTFSELKSAWLSVDQDIHVHNFLNAKTWTSSALSSGFKSIYFLEDESVLNFPNQKSSLQHIKNIGAHNLDHDRPKHLIGKNRYQKFSKAFSNYSKSSPEYSLTYENYFFGYIKPE